MRLPEEPVNEFQAASQVHGPYWSPSQAPLLERWMDARRRRLDARER
jgi:hypothetical protein